MKDDIKQIQDRINALKTPPAQKARQYANSSLGFRIVVELLSGIVIGTGIGFFIDDALNTKPIFLIAFLFFGAAAGILNVYRIAKKQGEKRG